MKRVFNCVLAIMILILAVLPLTGKVANAASLRNKKIVSVVYDDSGSMYGPNWAYANYAMQTFVAMLNEDDELYITYMSDEFSSVRINTNDLLSAVTDVRNHSDSGVTPYASVTTAMEQLEKVSDDNPNTQYWLVVFTDGGFNDETIDNVAKDLDKFSSKKMANDSKPQIMYMTIGDELDIYTPHPSDTDITVIRAQKEEDIRDSLFDIASRVTGRIRVEDRDISVIDDHTLSLSSNVPLLNISILVQNKDVSVDSIMDSDKHEIPIKYEIPVKMPDPSISSAGNVKDMFGAVTLAGELQGNISAGNYTITFSDAISKEDVVVMLEPALQLKIKLFIDGNEVTDVDDITLLTEDLSAEAAIYEYGTDNVIMESLLPGKVVEQMTFSVDGQIVDNTDKLIMDQLAIGEGDNVVHAVLDISGFFHLETSIDFTPRRIPDIDRIEAELSYDGSPRKKHKDGSCDAENVVYISDLKKNRTGIRFTVYQDGELITQTMAKSLEKGFRSGLQIDFSNYEVEIQSDGSFLVYPAKKPWFVPMELYYLLHHGEQTVGVELDNVSAEGVLDFKLFSDNSIIPPHYLIYLLIAYIIWWILFKKHFPRCTLVAATGQNDNRGRVRYTERERIDLNWFGCFRDTNIFIILFNLIVLILPMPSRTRFCGYTFSGQYSTVKKNFNLLVRNVRGKAVNTSIPKPREESQESSVEMDETLFIRDGESYMKFFIEE